MERVEYVWYKMKLERSPKRHIEDRDFYCKSSGKPLNSLKKEYDTTICDLKVHSGHIIEKD